MKRTTILALILAAAGPVATAGAQLPPVDQPAVCLPCHGNVDRELQAPHVHTAFADGDCASCHNPHASRHAQLLARDAGALCLECHDDVVQAEAAAMHEPAAAGDCAACHHPHASDQPAQLLQPMGDLCRSCHEGAAAWPAQPVVHAPVADDACLDCHATHGSDVDRLLNASVPGLCLDCHDVDAAFDRAHAGRSVAATDCTACHDPHASPEAGLLRARQHAPFAEGDCVRCHSGLETDGSFAVAGDPGALCLECHRSVQAGENKRFHAHLELETACSSCHNPHASNEPALLKRAQRFQCMTCHFQDAEDRAAAMTHPGVDCVACHEIHASDDPQQLRTRESSLCADCHEQAHSVSHPVGPEVIDPRTEESVTCLSCHQLHNARYDQYLPLDPAMALCVQCHKR